MSILEVRGLQKIYTTRFGGNKVEALKNVTFSVEEGEYVAIMGESGSGKTTLLNILAALDKPTGGTVLLDGKDITRIKESAIAAFGEIIWDLYFRISISWIHFLWRIIYIFLWCWLKKRIRRWQGDLNRWP